MIATIVRIAVAIALVVAVPAAETAPVLAVDVLASRYSLEQGAVVVEAGQPVDLILVFDLRDGPAMRLSPSPTLEQDPAVRDELAPRVVELFGEDPALLTLRVVLASSAYTQHAFVEQPGPRDGGDVDIRLGITEVPLRIPANVLIIGDQSLVINVRAAGIDLRTPPLLVRCRPARP